MKTKLFISLLSIFIYSCGLSFAETKQNFGELSPAEAMSVQMFAEQYLEYLKNHNYEMLYNEMASVTKQRQSYEEMKKLLKIQEQKLGNLKSYYKLESTIPEYAPKIFSQILLQYACTFEKAKGIVTLFVDKEGDKFEIVAFNINSPELGN